MDNAPMTKIILGPTLETERLILRPPEERDLDAWAEMTADEKAMHFLGGVISRPESWRLIAGSIGTWVIRGFGMFSVLEKSSGKWVGRIGPIRPEGWPGTEVGWGLHPSFFGKGYAHEAASACIDWVFDEHGWSEVIHCIAPDNIASQKLAARLGSKKLRPGQMPPPWHKDKVDIWGQSAAEWRAQKA